MYFVIQLPAFFLLFMLFSHQVHGTTNVDHEGDLIACTVAAGRAAAGTGAAGAAAAGVTAAAGTTAPGTATGGRARRKGSKKWRRERERERERMRALGPKHGAHVFMRFEHPIRFDDVPKMARFALHQLHDAGE